MTVRRLSWMGVRSPAAAEMVRLWRDALGLEVVHDEPGATWLRTSDGSQVHVYADGDRDHDFFGAGPVIGLEVDRFEPARAALEAAGVEFCYGEPQRARGIAWQHFRAPDGNVYEIIGPDDAPATSGDLDR